MNLTRARARSARGLSRDAAMSVEAEGRGVFDDGDPDRRTTRRGASARSAARVGRHGRSQAPRADVRDLRPRLPRDRRPRSHDHADPARVSEPHRRVAAGVQSSLHDARDDDGLLRRHSDCVRVCELPRAVDDRRPRHGVSAPQRLQLLDQRVRRTAALFQLSGRRGAGGSGQRARCGLVRLRAAHGQGVFEGPQHRLLDHRALRRRIRQHRRGRQHRHHHAVHALSRHDARSHAARRLAQPGLGRHGAHRPHPAGGRADHAASSTAISARTSSTRRPAARRCSGSTSSGSSATPRCTC